MCLSSNIVILHVVSSISERRHWCRPWIVCSNLFASGVVKWVRLLFIVRLAESMDQRRPCALANLEIRSFLQSPETPLWWKHWDRCYKLGLTTLQRGSLQINQALIGGEALEEASVQTAHCLTLTTATGWMCSVWFRLLPDASWMWTHSPGETSRARQRIAFCFLAFQRMIHLCLDPFLQPFQTTGWDSLRWWAVEQSLHTV